MNKQNPLTDAQRTLVEENLGLVSFAMNKLPIYLFDSREDAFQIGVIGLMKAARSYDPGRKILFATYAVPCITNELRMVLRHINIANPPGRTFSYDSPIPEAESCSLLDLIPSTDQPVDESFTVHETLSEVLSALKKMKDSDALEIIHMVVQNRKQEEIADRLGITQSAITARSEKSALHSSKLSSTDFHILCRTRLHRVFCINPY